MMEMMRLPAPSISIQRLSTTTTGTAPVASTSISGTFMALTATSS